MWPAIAIALSAIIGAGMVLLFYRVRSQRIVADDIKRDIETKMSGWIARELQRHSDQKDQEAFSDFDDFFGKDGK